MASHLFQCHSLILKKKMNLKPNSNFWDVYNLPAHMFFCNTNLGS